MPSISLGQQKVLAIVPKITGSLSLVGSLFVLQDILRDKKKRSKSIFHKIMIGLSTSDVISSVANVLSTWPSPSNGDHNSSVYGAVGTTATCTAQGFFNELGSLTTPLYTASLCLRYLLVVRYNWRESQLQKYEALFHMIPIAIGCTMSIVGLPLNLYNNVGWICWFAAYPGGCTVDCSCTRGELAHTFQWIHFGFVWSAIAFVTVSMLLIYLKVRDRERRAQFLNEDQTASSMMHSVADTPSEESTMRRISRLLSFTNLTTSTGESREQRGARKRITNTKKVVIQASLYVGALYLTWIFATLTRILKTTQNKTYFGVLLLLTIFLPLQGAFNAFIYVRPRYLRRRSKRNKPGNKNSSIRAAQSPALPLYCSGSEASSENGAISGNLYSRKTSAPISGLGVVLEEECEAEEEEHHFPENLAERVAFQEMIAQLSSAAATDRPTDEGT